MSRSRAWLRAQAKINLGARAMEEGISLVEVERQEDTVLRACDMLDDIPGIILADEVGMGKTYEALGIAAVFREIKHSSRIVVITPGPDLNDKWEKEFERFSKIYDFKGTYKAVTRLDGFVEAVRDKKFPIVIAPVTMFSSGRSNFERAYIVSLFVHYLGCHGNTANAIFDRCGLNRSLRLNPVTAKFLGLFDYNQISNHLEDAFCSSIEHDIQGFEDIFKSDGLDGFYHNDTVRNAIYRARFVLTRALIPRADLLIVDEAHKLKNTWSLRARAMRRVFNKKFGKALFLTATPFQLDVGEIQAVFQLFSNATTASKDLMQEVETLLLSIRDYQEGYARFQDTWMQFDMEKAKKFRELFKHDHSEVDDPNVQLALNQVQALIDLKSAKVEPGFRRWMLRSLRKEKREYRQSIPIRLFNEGAKITPYLIYERYLAELFRHHNQTHKAAAEINMVSSFAAAASGQILSEDRHMNTDSQSQYRALLNNILSEINNEGMDSTGNGHVKVDHVVADAISVAINREKTLIFCARRESLAQIKRLLDAEWSNYLFSRWESIYPGITMEEVFGAGSEGEGRGLHYALQSRFGKSQDSLYLALREPYLRTLFEDDQVVNWAKRHIKAIWSLANDVLLSLRVGKTSAERLDYQVAKRCVEHATLRLWIESAQYPGNLPPSAENILDSRYINFGLDMIPDGEFEKDPVGEYQPQKRYISQQVVRTVLGHRSGFWELLRDELRPLPIEVRVRLVEQLGRYLTFRQVPFLADLLEYATKMNEPITPVVSQKMLRLFPKFWKMKKGEAWVELFRSFLKYFVTREKSHQEDIMEGPLRTREFARHTAVGTSRERLREAFNTPLYPMVLIANEVMQEGLDLHKSCKRIVHHDLAWNPAQIEQRIGRIDRHGSLLGRLREKDPDVTLDILYPLINRTIDERIFTVVKEREKWLEFLLGAAPKFDDYTLRESEAQPLPREVSDMLKVDLSPLRYPN